MEPSVFQTSNKCLCFTSISRLLTAGIFTEVFLFRPEELDYFCGPSGGASSLAPAAWRSFSSWLPSGISSAPAVAAAYRRAALGKDRWPWLRSVLNAMIQCGIQKLESFFSMIIMLRLFFKGVGWFWPLNRPSI